VGGTETTFPANYDDNALHPGSTTEYHGTDQTVRGMTYGHLVLGGTGTKTVGDNANIFTNDLTLNTGTALELRNERVLHVLGDHVLLDGTVVPNQGELWLEGFDETTLSTTGTVDLYNLLVSTPGGTTA